MVTIPPSSDLAAMALNGAALWSRDVEMVFGVYPDGDFFLDEPAEDYEATLTVDDFVSSRFTVSPNESLRSVIRKVRDACAEVRDILACAGIEYTDVDWEAEKARLTSL